MLRNPLGLSGVQSAIATVFVQAQDGGVASERRFDRSMTIQHLKERLEPITGVPAASMRITVLAASDQKQKVCVLTSDDKAVDEERMLGSFPIEDFMTFEVSDTDARSRAARKALMDLDSVKKFEMKDEDYQKRTDSVLAYKMRNKIGRFADGASSSAASEPDYKDEAEKITVGARCQVHPPPASEETASMDSDVMLKRGVVRFVGLVSFKPGWWVGVEYDEPVGKHDGSVGGASYFTCRPKHGVFVRPNRVEVGDFPEIDDLMMDDDEM